MAHHQAMKKKVNLKRSQTNACDLVMLPPAAAAHHHRAPLTAGVYEAFLPPPNLNSVGLPLTASRTGYHPHSRHSSRSQSFYMPNTTQSRSSHNLDMLGHLGEHPQLPFNLYHHRSVPNIPLSPPQQSSLTTPLF